MEERLKEFYDELDRYYEALDFQGLEEFLWRKQRENETACAACYNPLQVSVYNELGTFYRTIDQQQRSIECFQRAADIVLTHIGRETLEYATAVNNLAGSYRMAGALEEAKSSFEEAMAVYEILDGKSSYFYATAVNNLGLVYLQERKTQQAADCFAQALPVITFLQESRGGLEAELAVTLCNMATRSFYDGEREEAERLCREALSWYEQAPEGARGHMNSVCNLLGDLLWERGEKEAALAAFRDALRWTERFYGKNQEYEAIRKKLEENQEETGE